MTGKVRPGSERDGIIETPAEGVSDGLLGTSPAIAALRERPEEFEFSDDMLQHLNSRHAFRFQAEDKLKVHVDCGCSAMEVSPEQSEAFYAAYREWHASYWRPLEINREFASHFEPSLWRRAAIWLLRRLLAMPRWQKPASARANLALFMAPH